MRFKMKTKIIILLLIFSFAGLTAQNKGKFIELKKMPQLTKQVMPVYPEEAKKLGVTGKVVLELSIDAQGNVTKATVASSAIMAAESSVIKGSEEHSIDAVKKLKKNIFVQPAIDAAMKMRFSPGIDKNNKPIKCTVMQPVNFTLDAKKK
jgi:TonB family protein